MNLKNFAVALLLICGLLFATNAKTQAQVVVVEPGCEWGYYSYYPYACAPYGFYGDDWFYGGVFVGVGPWYGHHGYRGGGRGGYGNRDGYNGGHRGHQNAGKPEAGKPSGGAHTGGGGARTGGGGSHGGGGGAHTGGGGASHGGGGSHH